MPSYVRRLLEALGLRKPASRRSRPQIDNRYTYERDDKGRLLRHGPHGTERLSYETWQAIDAPDPERRGRRPMTPKP